MNRKRATLFYAIYVLGWTLLITATGALLGAIVYPLGGKLFGFDGTPGELARHGAQDLGFIAFIWAPGIGIVLAVRHAYQRRQSSSRSTRSASASTPASERTRES